MVEYNDLEKASTKQLVAELMRREGVEAKEIAPYEPYSIADTGPCIVLVIKD